MVAFFRKITRNWKLKTLAFSLAVLLWVVVSSEQVTTNWLWVPLEVQVTDANYRVDRTDLPTEVQVRLSGPARDLLDLVFREPPLVLTIGGVENPVETRTLEPRMVRLPPQMPVNAIDVRPGTLRLAFTRIDTKVVPVRVRITDRLGDDWAVVNTLATAPEEIEISGPVSRLDSVTEVFTRPVELTTTDTIIDRTVALDTTSLAGLELSSGSVRLTGRVDRVVERTLAQVPVDVGPGIAILPARVDVALRGPASAVRSVSTGTFRIVISIAEIPVRIPPGGVAVPLRIDRLRPGVTAVLSPAQVRLFPEPVAGDSVGPDAAPAGEIVTPPAPPGPE